MEIKTEKQRETQQIKKDEILPNSHLETRNKPEEENTGVKTGDVDNQSAENIIKQNVVKLLEVYGE